MLWDASTILGCAILGSDAEAGTVVDLLFDDSTWRMRWIVVNSRFRLRHDVLLPISVLRRLDPLGRRLEVDLTTQQIWHGLRAERHLPISREATSGDHDAHLRSVEAVIGHRAHLLDGVIGHIEDLLVEDADWSIRHIRVDTCRWRPGDRVLLAPHSVRQIDWSGRLVRFDVSRRELEDDPMCRDIVWVKCRGDQAHADA